MLYGDFIVFVAFIAQLNKIIQHFFSKNRQVGLFHIKANIPGHIMLAPVCQHPVSRWRLPPEKSWFIETDQCTVTMGTHIQIPDPQIGIKIIHTPCYSVHIVLHGCFCFHTGFFKSFERLQRCCQHLLLGQFVEIKIHSCELYPTFPHPLFQSGHLSGRSAFQVFVYSPRCFTRPSEFCLIGI